jgi:hypothetical protein
MFNSLRRRCVPTGPARQRSHARLRLEALEERALLSGTPGISPPAGTHFQVVSPQTIQVSQQATISVTALDLSNHRLTGYTGTIHFTSSDSNAVLPADYTFVASDNGKHTFHVTFKTAGNDSVTATDTTTATATGSATTIVSPLPVATHFNVVLPEKIVAGLPEQVKLVALDASNHVAVGYTGTVHFTSSDTKAGLPADYTFTAGDAGKHLFTVTLQTAGDQTVTATDKAIASIKGTGTEKVKAPGAVTHFLVLSTPAIPGGLSFQVIVIALDASNHLVPNYAGTVHFTSSDSSAALPSDYTFVGSDLGEHVFNVTLNKTGMQNVKVASTSNSSIKGKASVFVASNMWDFSDSHFDA